ncbi:MAG: chemotaxis protein CheA [Pseudomonadales bacterium]|jgi:two-component system chemotaxis sensor kinase CheA|nr:chemotaxis protein CheA [Pseudomonadales bacterium]
MSQSGDELDAIREAFFEEFWEGLETMERGVLELREGEADRERLDEIFRAAHSIKGGAATFGFDVIAAFVHDAETLLDQLREGERVADETFLQLMLEAVDCLRELAEPDAEAPSPRVRDVSERMQALVAGAAPGAAQAPPASAEDAPSRVTIRFEPGPDMLATGNCALPLFAELAGLGELEARVDLAGLPTLDDFEPERCYLAWDMELDSGAGIEDIRAAFDWVSVGATLDIQGAGAELTSETPAPAAAPAEAGSGTVDIGAVPESGRTSAPADGGGKPAARSRESSSMRVSIEKVDDLLNLVGELVITQSMLRSFDATNEEGLQRLKDGLEDLERHTRELQENVMQIRMLPISFVFGRFHRLVRDLSRQLGKQVKLEIEGEQTELDKTVLEKVGDPLMHLIRNSIDHGIESPEARTAAGKPAEGTLAISAGHEGGKIVIRVRDDGKGLDLDRILAKAQARGLVREGARLSPEEIADLIFAPGFSTAETVSDVSGRGVGMDVVRRNIQDLGGNVEISTEPGAGTTLTIRLPLTLAILDAQLVRAGDEIYVISLLSILQTIQRDPARIKSLPGGGRVCEVRGQYVPVTSITEAFGGDPEAEEGGLLVVVESDGESVGFFVDELLEQQQVVIKSLDANLGHVDGVTGATILGGGQVALILDVPGLVARWRTGSRPRSVQAA